MKKILTIILVLCSVASFGQMRGGAQYDPGAARKNLSNVDASATPSMTSITLSGKVRAAWADILGDIYASGTVKVSAGTAAAPAYTFSSDPDTGIYSAGANTLGFGVGGAESMRTTNGGNVLIATSTDDGVNKLQVNGEVKFAFNGTGAFKTRYATTGADAATTTVFVGDLGSSNGDMVTVYMDIVGSRDGPGYEKFHVMIGAYNNAGTIVFVDAAPAVISDISLGLGMTDPIITCEATGSVITIKMTILDAYSRVAINVTAAGYVRGVK